MKPLGNMLWTGALGLAMSITLAGCGKTLSQSKTIDVDDDEVTIEERTVTERRDGSIQVENKTTHKEYEDGRLKEKEVDREVELKAPNGEQ